MKRYEIWVYIIGGEGARCFCCGDVPKIGSLLNGHEVKLVGPGSNPKQFLAILAG